MTQVPPTHAPQSHTTPNPNPTPSSSTPSSTSTSKSTPRRLFRGAITPRTAAAPIAAFTMAVLLYTYAVTSISAAKRNAQLHRQADGGQLDMRRESLRRHGALESVEGTGGLELFRGVGGGGARRKGVGAEEGRAGGEAVAAASAATTAPAGRPTDKEARRLGEVPRMEGEKATPRRDRTEVEGALEGWKGREGAERLKSGPPSVGAGRERILEQGVGRGR